MNRARTAYSIARTGHAVMRGEHLLPANDACCQGAYLSTGNYRDCECIRQASRDALKGWRWLAEVAFVLFIWTGLAAALFA